MVDCIALVGPSNARFSARLVQRLTLDVRLKRREGLNTIVAVALSLRSVTSLADLIGQGTDATFLTKSLASLDALSAVILNVIHLERACAALLMTGLWLLNRGSCNEERASHRGLLIRSVDRLEADVSDVGGNAANLLR